MFFQFGTCITQLLVRLWHVLLQKFYALSSSYSRNNILTLSVNQIFSFDLLLAIMTVSGKYNTRSTVITHVTKDHRNHVDCGSICNVFCNVILFTINYRPFPHPAFENCLDRQCQLLVRTVRELSFCMGFTYFFIFRYNHLE